jgi:pimeloyl-ACP methyl ester carboxylesterase
MTDKDAILAQFFEQQEPKPYDAVFVAAALTRAQGRQNTHVLLLWLGVGSLVAMVLALAGPRIANAYAVMGPAAAPIAIVATVLFFTRRMLWARA